MNPRALMLIPWQIRLAHDRVVRDALVACGNPAPIKPDPPGGLVQIQAKIFKSKEFWDHMLKHQHTAGSVLDCSCRHGPVVNLQETV